MSTIISVVMPCFNGAKYIKTAVDSIINQTMRDWELIVVDDASTDNTTAILESITDTRIKILRRSVNRGYPVAMNAGIEHAIGKYIARMDVDDFSMPARLEEQLKAIELFPDASFCGLNRFRITPGNKMYADRNMPTRKYIYETWKDLMDKRRLFTDPSVLIEKEKVMTVGGYRTFQRSGMDVDLWLRVMEKFGPCITITTLLFGKRMEPCSLIFNPQTSLINQIPRILARQRAERPSDDVQDGKDIDVEEYKKSGWMKAGNKNERAGLLIGSLVTCLWFCDWKGVKVYYKQMKLVSDLTMVHIIFEVTKKIIQRLKNNPFVRYNPPV
ncbi:MAG: glycosyltransferase family 2 protein [Cyclobacteriaceae bacterium]|nr:glycosyltransferase family 2 protein [Cyclobacteriaceae bacterium]